MDTPTIFTIGSYNELAVKTLFTTGMMGTTPPTTQSAEKTSFTTSARIEQVVKMHWKKTRLLFSFSHSLHFFTSDSYLYFTIVGCFPPICSWNSQILKDPYHFLVLRLVIIDPLNS
jgi:hypothetical protein